MDITKEEMNKLRKIMMEFSISDPIKIVGHGSPLSRLIFCQILAEKFPQLVENEKMPSGKFPRTIVRNYLGYNDNRSIGYHLRENAIESIRYYKNYYHKYKVIRAAYFEDERYFKILEFKKTRDKSQEMMTKLMTEIVEEKIK